MGIKCPKCRFENFPETTYCGKRATRLDSSREPSEHGESLPSLTKPMWAAPEELLTGSRFAGRSQVIGIAHEHKHEVPGEPRKLAAEIPDSLARLILKCLEKGKTARYESASALDADRAAPSERIIQMIEALLNRELTTAAGFGHELLARNIPEKWAYMSIINEAWKKIEYQYCFGHLNDYPAAISALKKYIAVHITAMALIPLP